MTAAPLFERAALLVTVGGLLCIPLAGLLARSWMAGLRLALDLWTGAGLLRLGSRTDGRQLLAAVAIIAIRQLVNAALRARPPGGSGFPTWLGPLRRRLPRTRRSAGGPDVGRRRGGARRRTQPATPRSMFTAS